MVGVNVCPTSLIHAYSTHPYSNTLLTSALIIYNFTLIFVIPNILQFDYTALYTLLAADSLALIILSGFVESFAIIRPRYLNS